MKARFSYFSKLLYIATYFTYLFLIFFLIVIKLEMEHQLEEYRRRHIAFINLISVVYI